MRLSPALDSKLHDGRNLLTCARRPMWSTWNLAPANALHKHMSPINPSNSQWHISSSVSFKKEPLGQKPIFIQPLSSLKVHSGETVFMPGFLEFPSQKSSGFITNNINSTNKRCSFPLWGVQKIGFNAYSWCLLRACWAILLQSSQ